jgi:hypothetical protein
VVYRHDCLLFFKFHEVELQPWNGCWGIGGTPIVLANEVCISALFEETITTHIVP